MTNLRNCACGIRLGASLNPSASLSDLITIIPVYNGEPYLEDTLMSLAAQTRRPDQVIVIDDGSTDRTRDIVRSCQAIPCELVENERNLGLFPNLNRALEFAEEADFFHLLLADDRVRPDYLSRLTDELAESEPLSFAVSNYDWIDSTGAVTRSGGKGKGRRKRVGGEEFLRRQSLLQTVAVGSVLIRTGRRPLNIRFRSDMPHVADCVFYAELAAASHEIIEVGDALCEIRRHDANATSQNRRNLNAWVSDEYRAMVRIAGLMKQGEWRSWLHGHRQQCLFAARSRVKQQWTRGENPQFAREIAAVVQRETAWYHRFLGVSAVVLRDLLLGRNRPDRPR